MIRLGSSPVSIDSDGDGLLDGDELTIHNTNPARADLARLSASAQSGTDRRVPTTPGPSEGSQPLQVVEMTNRTTISRMLLAPARYTPVLQVAD